MDLYNFTSISYMFTTSCLSTLRTFYFFISEPNNSLWSLNTWMSDFIFRLLSIINSFLLLHSKHAHVYPFLTNSLHFKVPPLHLHLGCIHPLRTHCLSFVYSLYVPSCTTVLLQCCILIHNLCTGIMTIKSNF